MAERDENFKKAVEGLATSSDNDLMTKMTMTILLMEMAEEKGATEIVEELQEMAGHIQSEIQKRKRKGGEDKMEMWRKLRVELAKKIAATTQENVMELAMSGLPMLQAAAEGGVNEEVKKDGKELFCKAMEKLDEMGILKPDAPLRQDYARYKAELAPKTEELPLSDLFKGITLDDILNAPKADGLPNN